SSGNIQANEKISVASNAENTGNISTGDKFSAKDTRTTGKLVAKNNIDVKNLTNDGVVATEAKVKIDGELKNSGEIQATNHIKVLSNVENTGDILTDGSVSAKDMKTTKKLLAKGKIEVANLENSGELVTNSSLTIDGKLENIGNIQAIGKIS
ncbi:hypothetical protein, partial [Fusobacterium necrophorum]|uniref:hypothetical protein n=1 Tax=Fusobacterium necrophorum TaxID=859 RepID=UPI000561E7C5